MIIVETKVAMHDHSQHSRDRSPTTRRGTDGGLTVVKDPVCGMTVDPKMTPHHFELDGKTHHFCSAGCRTKFVAEPAMYLEPKPMSRPPAASVGTVYTCPMHPQIRQNGPGFCPLRS